jgi:hypothetical protein
MTTALTVPVALAGKTQLADVALIDLKERQGVPPTVMPVTLVRLVPVK